MSPVTFCYLYHEIVVLSSLLISCLLLFDVVDISASEISKYSEVFRTTNSCVIKAIEPRAVATVDDLKLAVLKINSLEEEGNISPWDEDHIPEEIVDSKPNPG